MAIQITVKGRGAELVAKFIAYRLGAVGKPKLIVDIPTGGVSTLPAIARRIEKLFQDDDRVRIAVEKVDSNWSIAEEIKRDRRAKGKKL